MAEAGTTSMGKVLIVDDDLAVLKGHERVLRHAGYEVVTATDGLRAKATLESGSFDVIVSDISMPGLDGLGLLRAVRERDLDVPVILVTGLPTPETAMRAVEYGAINYLAKPVVPRVLVELVAHAGRMHRLAKVKRQAMAHLGSEHATQVGDRAGLEGAFNRALAGLWMAFQPIVRWPSKSIYAYEALLRTSEPLLPNPGAVLDAAERLGRLHDLGRATRSRVAAAMLDSPADLMFFVNLHPQDLLDEQLYESAAPLSRESKRVVLELTERAALDGIDDVQGRVLKLRQMGYRVAIDDLGAGYAGLTAFAELRPEIVKLDMSLVRNVNQDEVKQKLVQTMVALCRELKLEIVAEGVETIEERDALAKAGADLLQGYLFAKPGKPFPSIDW